MLEIIAIIAVILAIAIAVVLILAATKPNIFRVVRAISIRGAGGADLSTDQRLLPMGRMVAL
jgi:hypothetical protein